MKTETSEVGRRPYLDGLRGVAACMVFFAHLIITLLPSVITFSQGEGHIYRLEKQVGLSPLGWIWNGEFAVCLFFVLSGFVLSEFCTMTRISLPAQVVRRYFRLAVPMLMTSFIAYVIMKLGLYKNYDASVDVTRSGWLSMWYRAFEPKFLSMAKEALYGAFVEGRALYNANLWTMRIELIGSLIVFVTFALFKNVYARGLAFLAVALMNWNNFFALFAVGALLYDFEDRIRAIFNAVVPDEVLRQRMALGLLIFGFYLGAYPHIHSGIQASWHFFLPERLTTLGWHMVGATLSISALLFSNVGQQIFGGPLARWLGKLSFVLYLIHLPILCSLTAWSAYLLRDLPYALNVLITGSLTIAVVFSASALLYTYVDVYTTSFSRYVGKTFDAWFPPQKSRTDGVVEPQVRSYAQ